MENFSKVYLISSDVVSRQNRDGSIVLMKTDNSDIFYKITGEATKVWNFLKEGKQPLEACQKISEQHSSISAEQIRQDVDSFIRELESKTLIISK